MSVLLKDMLFGIGVSHSCSDRLIEVTWQSSLPSVVNELRVGSLTVRLSGVYSSKRYVVRCAQATRTYFLTVEQMKRHYNWIIMKAFPYRVISPVSTEAGHMIWKFR
jgi:hypothetical protein